jgi:eukaryotic-like serine/threonine-protein kinase
VSDEGTLPALADYALISELGRGGTGVVYEARPLASGERVALKLIQAGEFAAPAELARFRDDALIASRFEHPNIVRILDCTHLYDDEPFFTMELIESGSLAQASWRERFGPAGAAARLLVTIARAVHFLHQRGVLHRDLKPANILLRTDGTPVVSDFGAAKLLDQARATCSGTIIGTLQYMSPEQISGRPDAITVLSDVYCLGALLYELLTGRPPFLDDDLPRLLQRIAHEQPLALRRIMPDCHPDLEIVCMCALAKDPKRRYASAAAFADDLERVLRGEPILARREATLARALRWARRHPWVTGAMASALTLLLFIAATASLVARMQERDLRSMALGLNAYAASAQAGAVLYQLREYASALEAAAREPRVQALAARPTPSLLASELEPYAAPFGTLLIVSAQGKKWARWPTPTRDWLFRPTAKHRDYWYAAQRLGLKGEQKAYVARSFRSSVDLKSVFALSIPIFDAERRFLGALAATIPATSARFATQRRGVVRAEPVTVLLGPDEDTGTGQGAAERSAEFTFLVHPSLRSGEHRRLDHASAAQLAAAFRSSVAPDAQFAPSHVPPLTRDDYRDPMLGGRWLAAFAPVGGTGYAVLVQSRETDVLSPTERLRQRLALGFGLGLALLAAALWALLRRTSRPA